MATEVQECDKVTIDSELMYGRRKKKEKEINSI